MADARGFFGRDDVFRLVEAVLSSDQNAIVLFGQRRIGKTSVLLRLRHLLPFPPFRPIYFDLMDRARKPLGTVLYELAATIAAEFDMPQPREADFAPTGESFRDQFLPLLLQSLGNDVRPIILFDEFDVLDVAAEERLPEAAAARAFFPFLRRLMEDEPRLAFVFVVGRKAEELSINVKATFKTVRYQRISVLDTESARQLIGLAESDGTLHFTAPAIDHLLSLTTGHPYFTQLVCQLLFDQAYAESPATAPTVDVNDVERVIPKALEAGENIFEWIWDGLPPAERVIFSAVAEVTGADDVISEEELTGVLQRHGIRILIRELELAPKTLIEWEMLRRVDGGYGFFIDLMRRWVAQRKPLPKVKDELDRINPIADQQYRLGYTFYRLGNLVEAVTPLKGALQANPNHLKARLLLGEVLRERGLLDESVRELEEAYRYDEDAARYPLVRGLLVQGEEMERAGREDDAVGVYERVLAISPHETLAAERRRTLVITQGDRALTTGDYDRALAAYREAGADEKVATVAAAQRALILETVHSEIGQLVEREDWDGAAEQYRRLIEADPQNDWSEELKGVEKEANLARRYAEGLGAEQQNKLVEAQRAFADVIGLRPDYKDAADRLASLIRNIRAQQQREKERLEATHREKERLEVEHREKERLEACLEAKQREKERLEATHREKERLEVEHREKERLEACLEAKQREKERLEVEQREKESLDAVLSRLKKQLGTALSKQKEKEHREAEQRWKEHLEAEEREKERSEAERQEKALAEAEQQEREQLEPDVPGFGWILLKDPTFIGMTMLLLIILLVVVIGRLVGN